MVKIFDGWINGPLPGPEGTAIPVERFPRDDQKPWSQLTSEPDLCLHTTEGGATLGDAYKRWEFPPNFACGDGKIVQLFPLGIASKAVDTKDTFLYQVELAWSVGGKSPTLIYLPTRPTLYPLVALTAFLHERRLIRTGIARPNDWPVALDPPFPAASDDYHRRTDGTWRRPGVYGHVEIPDDEHWDPGSFDYPSFFAMIRDLLGGEDEMSFEKDRSGRKRYRDRFKKFGRDPGPPPDSMEDPDVREGYISERFGVIYGPDGRFHSEGTAREVGVRRPPSGELNRTAEDQHAGPRSEPNPK